MSAKNLPQRMAWVNRRVKSDGNEDNQTTLSHFISLIPEPVFRDLVMATRRLGQPLPHEIVPYLNRVMEKTRSGVNRRCWSELEKNNDVIKHQNCSCGYCSGTGFIKSGLTQYKCWTCRGSGIINKYEYVGPVI